MEDARLVLNVDTVAKMLNLSRNSVYAGIKRGEIPHIVVGKRLLIPKVALDNLLSSAEAARGEKIPESGEVNS